MRQRLLHKCRTHTCTQTHTHTHTRSNKRHASSVARSVWDLSVEAGSGGVDVEHTARHMLVPRHIPHQDAPHPSPLPALCPQDPLRRARLVQVGFKDGEVLTAHQVLAQDPAPLPARQLPTVPRRERARAPRRQPQDTLSSSPTLQPSRARPAASLGDTLSPLSSLLSPLSSLPFPLSSLLSPLSPFLSPLSIIAVPHLSSLSLCLRSRSRSFLARSLLFRAPSLSTCLREPAEKEVRLTSVGVAVPLERGRCQQHLVHGEREPSEEEKGGARRGEGGGRRGGSQQDVREREGERDWGRGRGKRERWRGEERVCREGEKKVEERKRKEER
eukprot:3863592-Rhodomonas_salina.2